MGCSAVWFVAMHEQPTTATLHSVQLLRAVAATLVVLFHAQQAFARVAVQTAPSSQSYLFGFGAVGVHIFFVISGFIMVVTTKDDEKYRSKNFLKRRFLRIYPAYWICATLYVAAHFLMGAPYTLTLSQFVAALALWPTNAASIIGPAWTLSYEMFFYLCFAAARSFGLTKGIVLLGLGFGTSIALGLALNPVDPVPHLITNSLLLEFLLGSVVGWFYVHRRLPLRWAWWFLGAAVGLFLGGIAVGYERLPTVVVWGGPSVLLVLAVVCLEVRGGASRATRLAGRLGDSSYVLYLIHILVIALALHFTSAVPAVRRIDPALTAIFLACVAVVIGEALHRSLERPLLLWLNPRRSLVPLRT
jgi:exopolysaccharide production protein ExoZ